MDSTTEQNGATEMTQIERRENEAIAIAIDEQAPILDHTPDWTFFTLDDGEVIDGRIVRTHFDWNVFKFEPFAS